MGSRRVEGFNPILPRSRFRCVHAGGEPMTAPFQSDRAPFLVALMGPPVTTARFSSILPRSWFRLTWATHSLIGHSVSIRSCRAAGLAHLGAGRRSARWRVSIRSCRAPGFAACAAPALPVSLRVLPLWPEPARVFQSDLAALPVSPRHARSPRGDHPRFNPILPRSRFRPEDIKSRLTRVEGFQSDLAALWFRPTRCSFTARPRRRFNPILPRFRFRPPRFVNPCEARR